ncbi:tetraacyldisaccharide 4'-kinase [Algoriphagus sp. CAU 1675]|uniref:tetraacyldisaccharide 4'-kinase n=1 Tax=Algoriphagus sp. CAU 1675 TaxID=3032597 RepID=UPI0023DB1A18|nr:tetraacyldisaccharide 4'-kinase [Algoriphagus sp. CAU 1675]MDF2158346.1 tetraacyldisaccharide 4'-kinase [Algoriphagus sp. CAU 1675]
MSLLVFLLYPFSVIYDLVTRVRNLLFDLGIFKTTPTGMPSILVGNLSVGGTGKTPMVEYLIDTLKDNRKIGTLSRGYGRKTSGFLEADLGSSPLQIGDEPFQIFEKYKGEVSVFVGEDRVKAVEEILEKDTLPELLILDDAYQHRYIKADLSILLTTYNRPFFKDFLLPAGRLRESRNGAKRADILVVTKCPIGLDEVQKDLFRKQIKNYTGPETPVLFSEIGYGVPISEKEDCVFSDSVILLSGIADDSLLVSFARENYDLLEVIRYRDHHEYSEKDMLDIQEVYRKHQGKNPVLLTTEKDIAKVKSLSSKGFLAEIPIFVLPIRMKFSSGDQGVLNQLIQQKVLQRDQSR